jgi:kumamolisin
VAASIESVIGFDNRPLARPHFRRTPLLADLSGATVSFDPPEVAALYRFPAGTDGSGQTVAIIELGGGYQSRDLRQYFQELDIPMPEVEAVGVSGGANAPTGDPNGPDAEVDLDIEVVGSVAPGAKIVVYFAPNTDRGFTNAVLAAVHDTRRKPSIISISWGAAEARWPLPARRLMNQSFQAAAAMGVSVFAAAGDGGSSDGVPGRQAHVDFPASSPFAIGCGGTALGRAADQVADETVWNDPSGATGGGVSAIFAVPGYQESINPTSANPPGLSGRGVPDVAGGASPLTGYNVLVDGAAEAIGGTSAVAPLWAALVARIQQQIGHSVAPLLPALYAAPQAFNDITVGSNGAYSAKRGWDACTGLGSPDGTALAAALGGRPGAATEPAKPSARAARPRAKAATPPSKRSQARRKAVSADKEPASSGESGTRATKPVRRRSRASQAKARTGGSTGDDAPESSRQPSSGSSSRR